MKTKSIALLFAALAATVVASAVEVRINGASTTLNAVIAPCKAAVESATGLTLKAVGTNTGKGLVALVDGQCDVALSSEPLDVSMAAAKFAGKELNASDFQIHPVAEAKLAWVVNPANPVKSLTAAQIKDILTGKVANWKEVGGDDVAIVVVTDPVGAGTRTLIQFEAMNREEFAPKTRALENIRVISGAVAELKGAFTGIGTNFVDPKLVKVVESDKVITRPLGFITKGAPSADVQKVINAYKAEVAKNGAK